MTKNEIKVLSAILFYGMVMFSINDFTRENPEINALIFTGSFIAWVYSYILVLAGEGKKERVKE